MEKTYTEEDILRYIYSETSEEESKQIVISLSNNKHLMDYFNETLELLSFLDKNLQVPRKGIIEMLDEEARNENMEA